MVNYYVYEEEEPDYKIEELLKDPNVKIGDTITLQTNNQEGYKKWEVILDEHGNKVKK